jgi:hypothetical protein
LYLKLGRLDFLAEEGFCISGNTTQQSPDTRLWRLRPLRPQMV